jgi:hypothetical protein
MMTLEAIEREIYALSIEERKQLIMTIVDSMVGSNRVTPKHSILEFEGIAEHLRDEMDAQEYVNQLRSEWDDRP